MAPKNQPLFQEKTPFHAPKIHIEISGGGQAAEAYSLLDQGKIAGRALIDMGE